MATWKETRFIQINLPQNAMFRQKPGFSPPHSLEVTACRGSPCGCPEETRFLHIDLDQKVIILDQKPGIHPKHVTVTFEVTVTFGRNRVSHTGRVGIKPTPAVGEYGFRGCVDFSPAINLVSPYRSSQQ